MLGRGHHASSSCVDVFNNTVEGLRGRRRSGATPAGATRRSSGCSPSPSPTAPALETDEPARRRRHHLRDPQLRHRRSRSDRRADRRQDKKIAIGVIDHHTLQVESPEEVAELGRAALQHIPPERLVLVTDCGMGREGMSRRHAFTRCRRIGPRHEHPAQELGLPEAECRAADPALSLIPAP